MEKRAHERGYQMRWDNSAWELLQYIEFIKERREIIAGRGRKFTRQKPSILELKTAPLSRNSKSLRTSDSVFLNDNRIPTVILEPVPLPVNILRKDLETIGKSKFIDVIFIMFN
ncbi:hypothetical protein ACFL5Z_20480 [Planctomycetota bacterium]